VVEAPVHWHLVHMPKSRPAFSKDCVLTICCIVYLLFKLQYVAFCILPDIENGLN